MADPSRLGIILVRPQTFAPELLRQLAADAQVDLAIETVDSVTAAAAQINAGHPVDGVVFDGLVTPTDIALFPTGLPLLVVAEMSAVEENAVVLAGAAGVFAPSRLCRLPTALRREAVMAAEHKNLLQAEADRTKLLAQLVHAQKMEAVGTLAGGLAHDLNNVLMGILGNAEMALEDVGDHPAGTFLADVIGATNRARDVVQRVLTFSRKRQPARRSDSLAQVVDDAVVLLRASLPATIDLVVRHDPAIPAALIDANQINQVITNLATNAADAIGGRPGRITLTSAVIDVDLALARTHVNLGVRRYVRLSVADDGRGIPPQDLPRIFEPFFTTKAPGAGTGLGLAVAHGIIEEHDGAITIDTEVGRGTTVHLYLPALEAARTAADTGAPVPRGAGEAVLLVDDEAMVVRTGARMLERLGYRATAADSAAAALDLFAADPSRFQVVISDLTMPGYTGLDLARRFRTINPEIKFILTTGHLGAEHHPLPDTDALLPKPFAASRLAQVLHDVLHRSERASR